jgi:hypothetical protein
MALLDIVPTALARDLVILFALDQYGSLDATKDAVVREEILTMVFYVYLVSFLIIHARYFASIALFHLRWIRELLCHRTRMIDMSMPTHLYR